jgi:hypothetical protein
MVFYLSEFTAIRWKQYKAHLVVFERIGSLMSPAQSLGQIPLIYNLNMDPKEMYNVAGQSGGTPLFQPTMGAAAPYLASFQEYPNGEYSKIERAE